MIRPIEVNTCSRSVRSDAGTWANCDLVRVYHDLGLQSRLRRDMLRYAGGAGALTRLFLVLVLAVGLSGCGFLKEKFAFLRHGPSSRTAQAAAAPAPLPAPKPAEGLWAILDPGCPKPNAANFKAWPHCASPFWISRDTAVVVRSLPNSRGATPDQSYRADYRLAAGDPVIAQVGTEKDGYLFLALTELARDDQGRLVAASGAAFVCSPTVGGPIALRPNVNNCDTESPDGVRRAAQETLVDHAALSRVAWIASGAP